VVGQALQLTNILLDWPVDVRRGRCYVPAEWLAAHGLGAADLVDASRPGVSALARRLEDLARAALARVPDYLDTIPARHVRYRLFCLWPALWALGSLRQARRDPEFPWGARRPKLPRAELWGAAWSSLFAVRDGRALRRLYAAASPAPGS
jgi:farnesyl-diphosphate farnesyltransferase